MSSVTKSGKSNITSPNGNSLAVFVDGLDGVLKLKDVRGNIQPISDYIGVIPIVPSTLNYGLYAQTGNSTAVTGTDLETSIINGGLGTLSVPANGFQEGDSFRAILSGIMNASNNQTLRIKVKTETIVLLDSGVQSLTNSIANDIWSMNIDFTIRQVGGIGVATIVSLGNFNYTKTSNASLQGFAFNTINNTTFDTTIDNTLDITVQWGSNDVGNSIYSDVFVLNKIF